MYALCKNTTLHNYPVRNIIRLIALGYLCGTNIVNPELNVNFFKSLSRLSSEGCPKQLFPPTICGNPRRKMSTYSSSNRQQLSLHRLTGWRMQHNYVRTLSSLHEWATLQSSPEARTTSKADGPMTVFDL